MQLERIKALAKELQPQEDELHSKLPATARKILEGKRILLLQRLMREAGIPGIHQGGKLRQIDDFSRHLPNATVGQPEKLELGGIDEILTIARSMEEIRSGRLSSHVCEDGLVIYFRCHPDWKTHMNAGQNC